MQELLCRKPLSNDMLNGGTFCGLFQCVAEHYSEKPAIVCKGQSLTYGELEHRSNLIAYKLIARGVKREDIVAIATGRSPDTLAAMLGVWKAGAAFFYLNPASPSSQPEELHRRCRCPLAIDEAFLAGIAWSECVPGRLDFSVPEGLALLIFTSGSTAKPKGVMIEHQNILAMIQSTFDYFPTQEDNVCVFPSLAFVAALNDFFPALLAGATLHLIEEERRRDVHQILEYFITHGITVSFLPPHMAEKFAKLEQGQTKLRRLLVGSERLRNIAPQRYEVRHVYGASEACSIISDYIVKDASNTFPIGRVKSGFRFYVVGQDGCPVAPGQEGELWLSGRQVSRGYYCDPERTAQQYILNPFSAEADYARVFKTGDIVRQLEDGNLDYVSRKDNMFKIRGFRVEASAVESVLQQYPEIDDAVVKAFPDAGGTNILCGYYLSRHALSSEKIKEFLNERLPYYMVPACLIRMEEFPRNQNNKIMRGDFKPPAELNDHMLLSRTH
ncbi:Surfactin synthase subunit 1 [bioreactor metagenome]|uniref:Surfactin synthase subunit 1 n=1 Tax=bioreactor metagenome TaxID=1076179 RepID=A0A644YQ26_9ZZZZ